jgi:DNA-binding NarL/FixJ family response regulator
MNIIIADKQAIFREGIKTFLSEINNLKIVGEVENRNDLKNHLISFQPDILLIDHQGLADFSIMDFDIIHQYSERTKILVLSQDTNEININSVIKFTTVKGYYLKDCSKLDLITSLLVIENGGKSYCNKVSEAIFNNRVQKNNPDYLLKKLTLREIEIVKLVSLGITAKEIAEKLLISNHTVNTYRKNILKKLNVKNSSELVMFAIKSKLIDTNDYSI